MPLAVLLLILNPHLPLFTTLVFPDRLDSPTRATVFAPGHACGRDVSGRVATDRCG
jgi:hypothetical protein